MKLKNGWNQIAYEPLVRAFNKALHPDCLIRVLEMGNNNFQGKIEIGHIMCGNVYVSLKSKDADSAINEMDDYARAVFTDLHSFYETLIKTLPDI